MAPATPTMHPSQPCQHGLPGAPPTHWRRKLRRAAVSRRNCAATGSAKPTLSSTQTPTWLQAQPPSDAASGLSTPPALLLLAMTARRSRQLPPPEGWPGMGATWPSMPAQRARLAKRARAAGPEKAGEAHTSGSAARDTSSRLDACTSMNQRKGRRHSQGRVFTPCRRRGDEGSRARALVREGSVP